MLALAECRSKPSQRSVVSPLSPPPACGTRTPSSPLKVDEPEYSVTLFGHLGFEVFALITWSKPLTFSEVKNTFTLEQISGPCFSMRVKNFPWFDLPSFGPTSFNLARFGPQREDIFNIFFDHQCSRSFCHWLRTLTFLDVRSPFFLIKAFFCASALVQAINLLGCHEQIALWSH